MVEKEIKIVVDTKSAEKNVKSLTDDVNDLGKSAKKTGAQSENAISGVGDASKKSKKSVGGLSKGFKGLGTALKAAGIGLIIAAVAGLTAAFSKNQKVVDAVSVVTESIGIVFSKLTDTIVNIYTAVSSSSENFDALGKVIKGLVTIALTPLKNTFFAIKLALQTAQLAWEDSFFGGGDKDKIAELQSDILETKTSIGEVAQSAIDAGKDIVNNVGEAVGEIGGIVKTIQTEVDKLDFSNVTELAKANVALANSAKLAVAQQSRLVEQYDRQAEKLRQIRDADLNTIDERIKANEELGLVLEKQEKAMLATANAQVANAQAQLAINNNIENQIALTDALANKEGVLAQVEGFRSEQLTNVNSLLREQFDLTLSIANGESERQIAQLAFEESIAKTEEEKFAKQKERLELERQLLADDIAQKRELYQEGTQSRVDAENEYVLAKQDIDNQLLLNKDEAAQAELDKDAEIFELKREAEQERALIIAEDKAANGELDPLEKLEAEKEVLELQNEQLAEDYEAKQELYKDDKVKLAEIDEQYKTGKLQIDNQLRDNAKAVGEADITIAQAVNDNKVALAGNTANLLAGIAKEGSDLAKGVAVAQATIDTYSSAVSSYNSLSGIPIVGPVLGGLAAGAAVASGFANVKKILKTKPIEKSAPSGGGSIPAAPAPSFNLVEGSGTNQIAEGIAGQNQPIQAFVVSGEVTTAQSLDRNIVDDSGF